MKWSLNAMCDIPTSWFSVPLNRISLYFVIKSSHHSTVMLQFQLSISSVDIVVVNGIEYIIPAAVAASSILLLIIQ